MWVQFASLKIVVYQIRDRNINISSELQAGKRFVYELTKPK